jgi:hypothetical protein
MTSLSKCDMTAEPEYHQEAASTTQSHYQDIQPYDHEDVLGVRPSDTILVNYCQDLPALFTARN